MQSHPGSMSDETFHGYVHPLHNRRFYLALSVSIVLFPLIALGLIAGTIVMVVPVVAVVLWVGMRIFFAKMLGNSILVSPENYPRILAMTEDIKARMGYMKTIHVFVYEQGSFNAYMRHLFFRRAIFLNSELLQAGVSDREVRWLIGRFVGYMRARQQAGVLGWVIRAAQRLLVVNVFILPYERAMVHTGDRLALAEIDGDIASATSAIQKLLVGRELGYSVNPEGFVAQHRHVKGSIFAFLAQLWMSHPHMTARYVDLLLFARTFFPGQYRVFEASNPGLPVDIAALGITQQSDTGEPLPVRAPWGWTCAAATLAGLVVVGVLTVSAVDAMSDTAAYDVGAPATALFEEEERHDDRHVIGEQTPAPEPASVAPPHTYVDESGGLRPVAGCRWLNDDPNDLRVVCDQP